MEINDDIINEKPIFEIGVKRQDELRDAIGSLVAIASSITSLAREWLFDALYIANNKSSDFRNNNSILYCDTDSIVLL